MFSFKEPDIVDILRGLRVPNHPDYAQDIIEQAITEIEKLRNEVSDLKEEASHGSWH